MLLHLSAQLQLGRGEGSGFEVFTEVLLRAGTSEGRSSVTSLKTTVTAVVAAVELHSPLHNLDPHDSTF